MLLLLLSTGLALATPASTATVLYRTRAELGPAAALLPKDIDLGKMDLLALSPPPLDKVKGILLVQPPGPDGQSAMQHYGEPAPPPPDPPVQIRIRVSAENVEVVEVRDYNKDPCCMGIQPGPDHPCGRPRSPFEEPKPPQHLTLYVLPEGVSPLVIHRLEQIPCMAP